MTRSLTLAVVTDPAADPAATLACLPAAARRLVVRGTPHGAPPGVEALVVPGTLDRRAAAEAVHRAAPPGVVVVLDAGEQPSAELVAALEGLATSDAPGPWSAVAVQPFLGRTIEVGTTTFAWAGRPGSATAPTLLPGRLVREARDVTGMIAWIDRRAAVVSHAPPRVGVADFTSRPCGALVRRLWRRRADGTPGLIYSILETFGEVLTAAKAWERGLAATRPPLPDGFARVEMPRRVVTVRRDLHDALVGPLLGASPDVVEGEPLERGGRGATWLLPMRGGGRAVLRWYRRGGLLRHVIRDRYLGWQPRPLRELALTEEARRRGVPAPEVLAVRVDRLVGGSYRGAIVTREIPDVETLAELVRRRPAAAEREAVLTAVGRTIAALHACGLEHRDLNAGNLLVRAAPEVVVHVIDFDRARIRTVVSPRVGRRALRRLARSLRKLGLGDEAAATIARAYEEAR